MCIALSVTLMLSGCDSRSAMTPENVLEAFEAQPNLPVSNVKDVTQTECTDEVPCVSALAADELSIYKFSSQDDAKAFADTLGTDGYQSDWIVLNFEHATGAEESDNLRYGALIDAMWTDS
ncbi:hypothetical protein JF66_22050 [Cryobacterium sp. MLB-32]|nr:hypothetical protein JF66_22050 [Cryobacterium sp. MLB-32]